MEAIKNKFDNFIKTYKALDKSMKVLHRVASQVPEDEHDVIVAGVIKHFELTYETTWKFLKEYIAINHNEEILSPRSVFKACYAYGILPQEITDDLLELVDDRNLTVHIYDHITAEEICSSIAKYYMSLGKIIELLGPNIITNF